MKIPTRTFSIKFSNPFSNHRPFVPQHEKVFLPKPLPLPASWSPFLLPLPTPALLCTLDCRAGCSAGWVSDQQFRNTLTFYAFKGVNCNLYCMCIILTCSVSVFYFLYKALDRKLLLNFFYIQLNCIQINSIFNNCFLCFFIILI